MSESERPSQNKHPSRSPKPNRCGSRNSTNSRRLSLLLAIFCRAELAVRMSAQTAIEDAEKRAKKARDEHERSTKELDEQLAAAKVSNVRLGRLRGSMISSILSHFANPTLFFVSRSPGQSSHEMRG